jgi:hypothetical protein
MGYILDETLDSSVLAIHKVIADANDCHGLLEQVTGQLREIFAFDSLSVTGISEERNHLVQIFEHPPPPCFVSPTKWWPMPGFVKSMIDKGEDGPLNLVEMFATPEFKAFAEIEEDALRFEQRGFRSCVRVAVRRSGKLVNAGAAAQGRPGLHGRRSPAPAATASQRGGTGGDEFRSEE